MTLDSPLCLMGLALVSSMFLASRVILALLPLAKAMVSEPSLEYPQYLLLCQPVSF